MDCWAPDIHAGNVIDASLIIHSKFPHSRHSYQFSKRRLIKSQVKLKTTWMGMRSIYSIIQSDVRWRWFAQHRWEWKFLMLRIMKLSIRSSMLLSCEYFSFPTFILLLRLIDFFCMKVKFLLQKNYFCWFNGRICCVEKRFWILEYFFFLVTWSDIFGMRSKVVVNLALNERIHFSSLSAYSTRCN